MSWKLVFVVGKKKKHIQVNCFSSNFVYRSILCTFAKRSCFILPDALFMRTTRIWTIWKEITMIKYVQLRVRSLLKHATSMIFQCFVSFQFFFLRFSFKLCCCCFEGYWLFNSILRVQISWLQAITHSQTVILLLFAWTQNALPIGR